MLRAFLVLAVALARAATADGQPLSPRNANYTIDVKLDVPARRLTAHETLGGTNVSSASTDELQFHLYYNAWRNHDSTWMREHRLTTWWQGVSRIRDEDFASIDISNLTLTAASGPYDLTQQMRFIAPDDGNEHDRTVMGGTLPE